MAARTTEVFFTVTGEWLTHTARELWADELRCEMAIRLLKDGLVGIDMGLVMQILTGDRKVIRDSSPPEYLGIADDDATETDAGSPLAIEAVMGAIEKRRIDAEARARDFVALANGDYELAPSLEGLVEIPRWRYKAFRSGEVTLSDIEYALASADDNVSVPRCTNEGPGWSADSMAHARAELGAEIGVKLPSVTEFVEQQQRLADEADEPIKAEYEITHPFGWLSPDGKFYRCGYMEHIPVAGRIVADDNDRNPERTLEERGYIKLAGSTDRSFPPYLGMKRTGRAAQRQIDALFDWFADKGKGGGKLPEWLRKQLKEG